MKISKNTLNILSAFSNLNSSITIKEGNEIATINVGKENNRIVPIKTILVSAEVEEKFPISFSIYDLKQFIQIIESFDEEPDFQFEENFVTISENTNKIKYAYCDDNIVLSPSRNYLKIDEIKTSFIVDSKTIVKLKKISNIMKHDDLFVKKSETGGVDLVLTTFNEGCANTLNDFVISIDLEEPIQSDFDVLFSMKDISTININKEGYLVMIGENNGTDVIVFTSLGDTKLVYYICCKAS